MVIAFVFAALTVIYNVIMRRMERLGKERSLALERIDLALLWAYPLLYLISVWILFQITG